MRAYGFTAAAGVNSGDWKLRDGSYGVAGPAVLGREVAGNATGKVGRGASPRSSAQGVSTSLVKPRPSRFRGVLGPALTVVPLGSPCAGRLPRRHTDRPRA